MQIIPIILIVVAGVAVLVAVPWLIGFSCRRCGARPPRIIRRLIASMLTASACQFAGFGLAWAVGNWLSPMIQQPIIITGMAVVAIAVMHLCLLELGIHRVRVLWRPALLIFLAVLAFDFAMITLGVVSAGPA